MERLSIPPEFSSYAEEKGIFTLYEGMLQALLAARPDDPLQFLSHYLSKDRGKSMYMYVHLVVSRSQTPSWSGITPNFLAFEREWV